MPFKLARSLIDLGRNNIAQSVRLNPSSIASMSFQWLKTLDFTEKRLKTEEIHWGGR